MKKTLLLSLAILIGPLCLHAQNPVPNPSFESWSGGNPVDWITNNVTGVLNAVTQVSPGNTGASAMKGEVLSFSGTNFPPLAYCGMLGGTGFPITQAYTNLQFYYKFVAIDPNDQVDAIVLIQDVTPNPIAAGSAIFNATSTLFTQGNVQINYSGVNPDNAIVEFTIANSITGTPGIGTYFIIDDVSLNFSSGVAENKTTGIGSIYPNPSTATINIPFHQTAADKVTLTIYDMQGRLIREIVNENPGAGIFKAVENISDLEDGMYECIMSSNAGVYATPFQVCH